MLQLKASGIAGQLIREGVKEKRKDAKIKNVKTIMLHRPMFS